jgi:hypothetical protein
MMRGAIAITRESVCWRPKAHANLITANSSFYDELSLARRDEAMDNLLASWDMAEPFNNDGQNFHFQGTGS